MRPAPNTNIISHIMRYPNGEPAAAVVAALQARLMDETDVRSLKIKHNGVIAAHALSVGATLVTDNVREFSRVPDLRVENWLD